jgi:hypothetical protein
MHLSEVIPHLLQHRHIYLYSVLTLITGVVKQFFKSHHVKLYGPLKHQQQANFYIVPAPTKAGSTSIVNHCESLKSVK